MFSVCYIPEIASQPGPNSPESLLPYRNDLDCSERRSQVFVASLLPAQPRC